ncbi:putative helicase [Bacillus sp. TS-2]|nr:putative helicase [Bacillus sp. TS-2]
MDETIIIHGGWIENQLFIWGEQKPQSKFEQVVNFQYPFLVDPFELKLLLFRQDEHSFYGTFIETEKAIIDVPLFKRRFQSLAGETTIYQAPEQKSSYSFPIFGVAFSIEEIVNYWNIFHLWRKEPAFQVAPDLLYWLDLFEEIQHYLFAGQFQPSADGSWQIAGFPFRKWEQELPPASIQLRQSTSLLHSSNSSSDPHPKLVKQFIHQLTDEAIRHLLKDLEVQGLYEKWVENTPKKWRALVENLERPSKLASTISNKKLQSQIGIHHLNPFSSGLLLKEPEKEEGDWHISLCMVDRDNPNLVIEMDALALGEHPWRINPIPQLKEDIIELKREVPFLNKLSIASSQISLTTEDAYRLYTEFDHKLEELGFSLIVPSSLKKPSSVKVNLLLQSNDEQGQGSEPFVDWQSIAQFSFKIALGDTEISEQEFRQYLQENQPFINKNGQWIVWNRNMAHRLKDYLEMSSKQTYFDTWKMTEDSTKVPNELNNIDFHIDWDGNMKNILQELYHQSPQSISLPKGFLGELRDYQHLGASWLYQLRRAGLGGCLADDMGLGKSVQTIVYILHVLEQNQKEQLKHHPFLLICPTSLIHNWAKECEAFAPNLKVFIHHGSSRLDMDTADRFDLIITSYQMAVRDQHFLAKIPWNGLIMDEAQHIKNIETKQRRTMKSIKAKHRIALTGTPIENKLRELWSIMDVLIPGYLGSHQHFLKHFIQPIERDKDEKRLKQLQHLIFPFILRRKKSDEHLQLGLPEKSEKIHEVPLSMEQAALYQNVVDELMNQLTEFDSMQRRAYILRSLTRLKQICNHPAHYLKNRDYQNHSSIKWDRFIQLVKNIAQTNQKVLIFTQYKEMGMIMSEALNEIFSKEIPFLHGSLSRSKRQEAITTFQENEEIPAFILSLKAGGVGLNLTAATHVIHYDRWWNPAVENQATDRAFRIGQTSNVTVHKFIAKGTLEEKIHQMITIKQGLADQVLSISEQRVTELSDDEIFSLIHLSASSN